MFVDVRLAFICEYFGSEFSTGQGTNKQGTIVPGSVNNERISFKKFFTTKVRLLSTLTFKRCKAKYNFFYIKIQYDDKKIKEKPKTKE